MFNLGFGEILIICAVLIIVVGPERLPTLMKTVGKTLRTVRQASQEIKATVGLDELMREDITRPLPPPKPRLAPVATVSRDADKPTDTTSGTVVGSTVAGSTVVGETPEAGAIAPAGSNLPGAEASEEVAAEPVMWAGVPEAKVLPYVAPQPPPAPALAEADGLSVTERMLLLHSPPPPPPVEPPSVPDLPTTAYQKPQKPESPAPSSTPSSTDSHQDPRGSATTPDANSAGDAGGDKGVG
jgi:sec-independent protein translocase protein TatB